MTEPAMATNGEAAPCSGLDIDAVLDRFHGDAVAALAAALEDVAFLRREIGFARLAMSYGFARGWRPAIERPNDEAAVAPPAPR